MYETFYGLRERPFSIQPDPGFFFLSERHAFAYTMLEYAVANQAGFAVITGEIGAGKTTLIRRLLGNLPSNIVVGLVTNTHEDHDNLLQWVMLAFGEHYEAPSDVALFDAFQHFLIDTYRAGNSALLIIDEAQNLSVPALEALRLLSNINVDKHHVLQIILTGQPQLRARLQAPELEQLAQRVSVDFNLPALKPDEVAAYIAHRLAVAGREAPLFSEDACAMIADHSGGIPRRINILCDTALVFGYGAGDDVIDAALVREMLEQLADAIA